MLLKAVTSSDEAMQPRWNHAVQRSVVQTMMHKVIQQKCLNWINIDIIELKAEISIVLYINVDTTFFNFS